MQRSKTSRHPRRPSVATGVDLANYQYTAICSECGHELEGRDRLCRRCADYKRNEQGLRNAKRNRGRTVAVQQWDSEFGPGQKLAVAAAIATGGFFVCKWLVTSVLWSDLHTSHQHTWGWVSLLLGLMLISTASLAVWKHVSERRDWKGLAGFAAAFLLVGVPYLISRGVELHAMENEIARQQELWRIEMTRGGYQLEATNE